MNEKHLKFFGEFCKYEKLTGGPDPHMADVVHMCKDLPVEQKVWRVALYVGVYNIPTAEAIWTKFPEHPQDNGVLFDFFYDHWEGLRFRRERKSVALDATHGENLTRYCDGAEWTIEHLLELHGETDFERVWEFAMGLPHVGRYAATKLVECWRRLGIVNVDCEDIRPRGGWSPRTALAMIYPEANHDPKGDDIGQANELAQDLREGHFPHLSWYDLEVMLCEYKTSYKTKRQFPGRSLDSELSYEKAIASYWAEQAGDPEPPPTEHMRTRIALHPRWALGEVQGWDPKERLKKLGHVVSKFGYTWSDSLYDYNATTDFANPVRRT